MEGKNHKTKRKTRTFSLKNINKILKTNPHLKEVFEKKESLVVLENEKTKSPLEVGKWFRP